MTGSEALLAELALRGFALLLGATAVTRLCRRRPVLRHLVWSLSSTGLVVLPATTMLLPALPLALLPGSSDRNEVLVGTPEPVPADEASGKSSAKAAPVSEPGDRSDAAPAGALSVLWCIGTVALLTRVGRDRLGLVLLRRRGAPAGESTLREARELARRTGLRREIRVLESSLVGAPFTCGLFRPIIVVPPESRDWDGERRRRILVHELAHVHRCDATWALMAEIATALFWWNPLSWFAARDAREASEAAADALVLAGGDRPSDYARDLLSVARESLGRPPSRSLPGVGRGHLGRRIEAVLDPGTPIATTRRAALAVGALSLLLVGAAIAVLPVRAASQDGEATPPSTAEPPWTPHQVRWGRGDEAGALFLEGDVDLEALVRHGTPPESAGLLVWFHRGADSTWRSVLGDSTDRTGWDALRRSLAMVAPDWAEHPDTSIGSLAVLPEVAGPRRDFSGSVILGVPGSSRDPGTGVIQAGWYEGNERIGVFARGPLELSPDGQRLVRLHPDGWLAAFGWTPAANRLRVVEALPGPDGEPLVSVTEDGLARTMGPATEGWLGRVLSRLPGLEPGTTRVSWRGEPG